MQIVYFGRIVWERATDKPYGHRWTDGLSCTVILLKFRSSLCSPACDTIEWAPSYLMVPKICSSGGCAGGDMFSLAEWLSHRVRPVSHSYNTFLLWSVGCRYRREPGFVGIWGILFVLQDDFHPQRPLSDNDLLQQSERSHGSSRPCALSGKWAEGTNKIAQGNVHVRGKYLLTLYLPLVPMYFWLKSYFHRENLIYT